MNTYCGRYYTASVGDYCNLICLKYRISLVDFVFLNPTINSKSVLLSDLVLNTLCSSSLPGICMPQEFCDLRPQLKDASRLEIGPGQREVLRQSVADGT